MINYVLTYHWTQQFCSGMQFCVWLVGKSQITSAVTLNHCWSKRIEFVCCLLDALSPWHICLRVQRQKFTRSYQLYQKSKTTQEICCINDIDGGWAVLHVQMCEADTNLLYQLRLKALIAARVPFTISLNCHKYFLCHFSCLGWLVWSSGAFILAIIIFLARNCSATL